MFNFLIITYAILFLPHLNNYNNLSTIDIAPANTVNNTIQQDKPSYATNKEVIVWGDMSDNLKTYEYDKYNNHTSNDYGYNCSIFFISNGIKTKEIDVDINMSNLSYYGKKTPILPPEKVDLNNFTSVLSISKNNSTYLYYCLEDGSFLTKQNGKFYNLNISGNDCFNFTASLTFYFLDFLSNQNIQTISLPEFDLDTYLDFKNSVSKENIHNYLKTYPSADFDVAVIFPGYENLPIKITTISNKQKILDIINNCTEILEDDNIWMGSGTIIRIYNNDICDNFLLTGAGLTNLQIDNSEVIFKVPENFHQLLYYSITDEIVKYLK